MKPCRLIYRSIAKPDTLKPDVLSRIENQAANNNRRLGVCGILTLSNGRFLQTLEGTPTFINKIYAKIVQDERHEQVELISYQEIVKPEFIDWDMKLLSLDKLDENIRDLLAKKYPTTENQFHFIDDAFLMTSLLIDIKHIFVKN